MKVTLRIPIPSTRNDRAENESTTFVMNKSRLIRMLSGEHDKAVFMGLWDKIKDFFRKDKKSEALQNLFYFLYPGYQTIRPSVNSLPGALNEEDGIKHTISLQAYRNLKSLIINMYVQNSFTWSVSFSNSNIMHSTFYLGELGLTQMEIPLKQSAGWPNEGGGDLRGADLRGADMRGVSLPGFDLSHANLTGANLTNALLWRANLQYAELNDAQLSESTLMEANLKHASLINADLQYANLINTTLKKAQFSAANLMQANLYGADLEGAIFRGANMEVTNLDLSNLSDADFSKARMNKSNMCRATLLNTILHNATLHGASLIIGSLSLAHADGAELTGINWLMPACTGEGQQAEAVIEFEHQKPQVVIKNHNLRETYQKSV